jgi:type IX secretion system PorP/SprF family membrane protein
MNKVTYILLLLSFFSVFAVNAQQDAQYTHYTHNMNVINPAYAGSRQTLSIGVLGRHQWVGFTDAPRTITASIHAPVAEKLGLGFSVISDKSGPVSEQNIYTDFSYTLTTSETTKLAFGIKGGVSLLNIGDNIILPDTETSADPVFANNENKFYPNFGAGLYFYSNKFYLGASVPNFLKSLYYEDVSGNQNQASETMHGFFTAGYVFDINDKLKFKPAAMMKAAVGAPLSFDVSGSFLINEKFELGANYRLDDSISGTFLINAFKDFRIGYAYDYTLSELSEYNSGSHEVILLWDILTSDVVVSPRFF